MLFDVSEDPIHPFGSATTTGYLFENPENKLEPIGSVTVVHEEGLVIVFNINPDYHGKGIGKRAFLMGYDKYSNLYDIRYVLGSWRFDLEYGHLENGESTNLNVFKKLIEGGMNETDAALGTPTGKWASSVGYDKVKVMVNHPEHVEVRFYRELPVEPKKHKAIDQEFDWLDL